MITEACEYYAYDFKADVCYRYSYCLNVSAAKCPTCITGQPDCVDG